MVVPPLPMIEPATLFEMRSLSAELGGSEPSGPRAKRHGVWRAIKEGVMMAGVVKKVAVMMAPAVVVVAMYQGNDGG
jgi:hypothetical protein